MKDIDFDELDRAVSSVLNTKDTSPASTPVSVQANPAIPPVMVDTPPPVTLPQEAQESPVVAQAPVVNVSPAARRGRFMDVVHPSSDMKSPPATTPLPLSTIRKPIVPLSPTIDPDPVQPPVAPIVDTTASDTTIVADSEPDTSDTHPTLDTLPEQSTPRIESPASSDIQWPDPLDVQEPSQQKEVAEPELSTDQPSVDTAIPDSMPDDSTPATELVEAEKPPETPATTPFLSDTKVDKRPLGAFAEPAAYDIDSRSPDPEQSATDTQDTNSKPLVQVALKELPRELDADLVAIEAQEAYSGEADDVDDDAEPKETQNDKPAPSSPVVTSIPQQYQPQEKEPDVAPHSVFDTTTYHQPLLMPKSHHKNLTWIWVLLFIGLLAVGAALGAFVFMAGF